MPQHACTAATCDASTCPFHRVDWMCFCISGLFGHGSGSQTCRVCDSLLGSASRSGTNQNSEMSMIMWDRFLVRNLRTSSCSEFSADCNLACCAPQQIQNWLHTKTLGDGSRFFVINSEEGPTPGLGRRQYSTADSVVWNAITMSSGYKVSCNKSLHSLSAPLIESISRNKHADCKLTAAQIVDGQALAAFEFASNQPLHDVQCQTQPKHVTVIDVVICLECKTKLAIASSGLLCLACNAVSAFACRK